MIHKDIATGAILVGFGSWFAWEAQSFPTLGGMTHGPGLFPTIAGVGLVICGLLILMTGILKSRRAGTVAAPEPASTTAIVNSLAVIIGVVLFALFLDRLGFHLVALPLVLGLLLLFRITWWKAIPLAIAVVVAVHFIFYSFLHVPLPWGLLEPVAW